MRPFAVPDLEPEEDGPPEPCGECQAIEPHADCDLRGWLHLAGRAARRCPGATAAATVKTLAACQVPARYRDAQLGTFQVTGIGAAQLKAARLACISYVSAWTRETSTGLLLSGPPGVGKSHLAAATLKAIVGRGGGSGLFVDFTKLLADVKATFDDPELCESSVLRPVMEADLLVLDELGAHRPSGFVSDTLYLVINTRYAERRPTLFTTNYLPDPPPKTEGLEARIGARLFSRLFEACAEPLLFDRCPDFRRRRKKPS